jgi:tetratricopeptide (TPR) repeat protein
VRPQEAIALVEQGYALAARGESAGAERAYRRAIELAPEMAESYYNLGVLLQGGGRDEEAIACYRKALARRPAFAEAHNNLGNLLRAHGRLEDACAQYLAALQHNPLLAEARSNLAGALNQLGPELMALGRWDEARAVFERAVALDPNDAGARNNLGQFLQDRDDLAGAVAQYTRALEIDPLHADAISNMGFVLEEQGRRDEAMAFYRRALEANPRLARAAFNLGVGHLCRGEFTPGWELLESRFDIVPPVTPRRSLALAPFAHADFGQGHRIAIWKEQGVGDQLVFATLLPELEARGERFTLEVDRRLVPAFRRAHPGWNVVGPDDSAAAFAGCDRQLALGSLAGLLRPDAASFASAPRSLLAADAARTVAYRDELGPAGKPLVGISWRSFRPRARGKVVRNKSAPLVTLAPLGRDRRLLDLQYGDTADERAAFAAAGHRLERLAGLDLFEDIDGVLAAIAACDVVVTTSNVTAHFAGALGKRTLLIYLRGQPPFHYWVPGPDGRSRWYPSIEIVSGPEVSTWDQAIAKAHERLGS